MSTLGDALNAIKSIILIEERVKTQGAKLDKLSESLVAMDRRLVRVETTLDIALRRGSAPPAPLSIAHDEAP
jgi:hypothetical protein